jgi:hypothetical protein
VSLVNGEHAWGRHSVLASFLTAGNKGFAPDGPLKNRVKRDENLSSAKFNSYLNGSSGRTKPLQGEACHERGESRNVR